mmetsp:Transcript_41277/g.97916  ORF Transcript_41277/g.97916 Transcript_41277/m.97916 type:complete len:266 (+) Transcript_41277:303-1100(+)
MRRLVSVSHARMSPSYRPSSCSTLLVAKGPKPCRALNRFTTSLVGVSLFSNQSCSNSRAWKAFARDIILLARYPTLASDLSDSSDWLHRSSGSGKATPPLPKCLHSNSFICMVRLNLILQLVTVFTMSSNRVGDLKVRPKPRAAATGWLVNHSRRSWSNRKMRVADLRATSISAVVNAAVDQSPSSKARCFLAWQIIIYATCCVRVLWPSGPDNIPWLSRLEAMKYFDRFTEKCSSVSGRKKTPSSSSRQGSAGNHILGASPKYP